jgi:uncharacterized membrane protein YeaQ/YmgE (transglycosylase-associated protein family)
MSIVEVLILLLIAGVCGVIGQALGGYARGGFVVAIALGFIGALLGMWMARALSLPEMFNITVGGVTFPILWSIIGAAIFMAVVGFLGRRHYDY